MKINKKPLVSIIIPVYNGVPFLAETIESIRKSSYQNFDIILVDDGSTDKSKHLCKSFEKQFPNIRFFWFSKNRGMTRVLNFGIKKAKGEFIARINQDDLLAPNRLKLQLKFLQAHPDHVAVGGAIALFSSENGVFDTVYFPKDDEAIRRQWLSLSPFSDPTVMYRKEAFLKTAGYDQNFWPADDVHMWYQLGKVGKLANLSQVITKVRWHRGAGSIKSHRLQIEKTLAVHKWARQNVGKPDLKTQLFWLIEYSAGKILPPQFNWLVYRQIRKIQLYWNFFGVFLKKLRAAKLSPKTTPVAIQPATANLSGK